METHRHDAISDGDAEERCEKAHAQQLGTIAANGGGALCQAPVVHTRRFHLQGPTEHAEGIGLRIFAHLASIYNICLNYIIYKPKNHEEVVVPSTKTLEAELVLNRVRE